MARSKNFDEDDILQRLRDLVLVKEKIVSADCFGREYLTFVYVDDVIDRSICTITVSCKCRIILIFFLFYTPTILTNRFPLTFSRNIMVSLLRLLNRESDD